MVPAQERLDGWEVLLDGLPDGRLAVGDNDGVGCFLQFWNCAGNVAEEVLVGICKLAFMDEIGNWNSGAILKVSDAKQEYRGIEVTKVEGGIIRQLLDRNIGSGCRQNAGSGNIHHFRTVQNN